MNLIAEPFSELLSLFYTLPIFYFIVQHTIETEVRN